ncbi:MAG: transposase [Nitrospirae bacterium]|nr:transposase [Nitrospirota bacterium]
MARPLRIQYPDAFYHVTCRGNERQNIFRDDEDRSRFIQQLNQSVKIYAVKLHSYVLMINHFHLLVETPLANLSEFMRHLNIAYIGYFNRRHNRAGHLYQGRFKAIIVDKDTYLSVLSRYIHLNPIRIKALEKAEPKEKYRRLVRNPWSSLAGYLSKRKRQRFVEYKLVLAEYGGDTDKARKSYRKALIEEMAQGKDIHKQVIAQTVLGGEEFIGWLKEKFLGEQKDREAPAHRAIRRHRSHEEIVDVVVRNTGKTLEEIKKEKGPVRQILMDLLHRQGGMTNPEIGRLFSVDYSSVSQERKRLWQRAEKDRKLSSLQRDIQNEMSRINSLLKKSVSA